MKALRGHFGGYVSVYYDKLERGVVYSLESKYHLLEDPSREVPYEDVMYSLPDPARGPFTRGDFGTCDRFAWPAGACAMAYDTKPMFWGERYAAWIEKDTLVIIDATRPTIARVIMQGLVSRYYTITAHAGRLTLQAYTEPLLVFAQGEIEALLARAGGAFTVEITELYPKRNKDSVAEVRVERLGDTVFGLMLERKKAIKFPHVPGVEFPMTVTLRDEILEDVFAEILVPGRDWQALNRLPVTTTVAGTCVIEDAIDPAGGLVRAAEAPGREADLDRLFSARADDPEDEATRLVLVDSLEDAGEPYAAQLAALVADPAADAKARNAALGTLASYLERIEYRGGLPYAAQLSSQAPTDEDIGDIVAGDRRLGFFHTLRIGDGNFKTYAKLVSSPRAVGLRHVDVTRVSVLQALIEGNQRGLKRLSGVKFATREMIDGIAHATFDGVEELEVETAPATVAKLLEFITRDETRFFARRPRHLLLATKANAQALVAEVLKMWDGLPVAKLTVAGRTLSKDGTSC